MKPLRLFDGQPGTEFITDSSLVQPANGISQGFAEAEVQLRRQPLEVAVSFDVYAHARRLHTQEHTVMYASRRRAG